MVAHYTIIFFFFPFKDVSLLSGPALVGTQTTGEPGVPLGPALGPPRVPPRGQVRPGGAGREDPDPRGRAPLGAGLQGRAALALTTRFCGLMRGRLRPFILL